MYLLTINKATTKIKQSNNSIVQEVTNNQSTSITTASIKLSNENEYTKTLKYCTDTQKCGSHKVAINGNQIQRIAIISPPSIVTESIASILKLALLSYYDNDVNALNSNIEIIPTTHVPPYGYGKNHGYSKIIRVMNNPLLSDVIGSLKEVSSNTIIEPSSRQNLFEQSLRQIIRFHCRLSHVAAHTTMYNLDLSSTDLLKELESILKLILDNSENVSLTDTTDLELHKQRMVNALQGIKSSYDTLLVPLLSKNSEYILQGAALLDRRGIDMLSNVLSDELDSTNNLKKWPCPSFWDVAKDSVGDNYGVGTVSKELANLLAPRCSDPHTTCSVKRDRCEEKGDVQCK